MEVIFAWTTSEHYTEFGLNVSFYGDPLTSAHKPLVLTAGCL